MKNISVYIKIINKYFKKKKTLPFMELLLENYNNRNIYLRIDFYKKEKVYKLSYIDLNSIESTNIETWINSCLVEPDTIYYIEDIMYKNKVNNNMVEDSNHRVCFNFYLKDFIHIEFNRFLPKELYFLVDVLILMFNNCPKKIEGFFYEMVAYISGNANKFYYNDEISFNLKKSNIDKLFSKEEIVKGKKYYEEDTVKFLEKIEDKYFALVEGIEEFVIIIQEIKEGKKIKIFCSCPSDIYCKHLYAVLTAIRNNIFKPFYKVVYEENKTPMLDRLMNFKFYLCVGMEREGLKIINKDGNIEIVPVIDINNKCGFKVIEDDDNLTLSKKMSLVSIKNSD
ncbi:MAG: SWIM zinc finger domain-containing protein [Bacilli bacterium]